MIAAFAAQGDVDHARQIITSKLLDYYAVWMQAYTGEHTVPICILRDTSLQIKVQKALIKAADVDAIVNE